MAIADTLAELATDISNAYDSIDDKGGTLPQSKNTNNLATAIDSIQTGTTSSGTINITENGTIDVTQYATADVRVVDRTETRNLLTNQLTEYSDDSITSLRDYAFYNLSNLESVSLPNLKQGVHYGFYGCSKLKNVYLPNMCNPNSLAGRYMFSGCTSLKFIELPKMYRIVYVMFANCSNLETISTKNLSLIENYSVSGCGKLVNLVLKGTTVASLSSATSLDGTPFKTGNYGGGKAYVPKALISDYQSNSLWQQIPYVSFLAIEENLVTLLSLGVDITDYYEIVSELPTIDIDDTIVYFIETATSGTYEQWFHGSGSWVQLSNITLGV